MSSRRATSRSEIPRIFSVTFSRLTSRSVSGSAPETSYKGFFLQEFAWRPDGSRWSDPFQDRGDSLSAADAQGDQSRPHPPPLELVERGAEEHGAGGSQRMAEGDGAAVDVHPLGCDAQVAHRLQGDDGEG